MQLDVRVLQLLHRGGDRRLDGFGSFARPPGILERVRELTLQFDDA